MRTLSSPHHLSPGELVLLRRFVDLLLARAAPGDVAAVRVFGSRARGLSHEESDLDVAVEAAQGVDSHALGRLAYQAGWDAAEALGLHGLRLSVITLPHAAGRARAGVYNAIDREGVELWPST